MSVDTLSKRVMGLESSLGLDGQGTYSERLLLLLDYIEAEPLANPAEGATATIDNETIEEKLVKIKSAIGASNDDGAELANAGSIEEALAKIEAALAQTTTE